MNTKTVSAPIARAFLVCPHRSFGVCSTIRGASPIFLFWRWLDRGESKEVLGIRGATAIRRADRVEEKRWKFSDDPHFAFVFFPATVASRFY
jgi:hypothetical protein